MNRFYFTSVFFAWFAFLWVSFAMVGCGTTGTESIPCNVNGKTYKTGDNFPSDDGCNVCICNEGKVACTTRGCAPQSCGTRGSQACAKGEFCNQPTHCGTTDKPGECKAIPTQPCATIAAPVCGCDNKTYPNECDAHKNGISIQAQGKCPETGKTCDYNGKTYKDGESYPSQDGCSTCTCKDGKTECKTDACPFKSCTYNGKEQKHGATFPATDGCNTCDCFDGKVTCTQKSCTKECTYNGKTYKEGESFPATDGCNTCTCSNGQVGCTKINCPPKPCTYDGKTYKDGEKFPATDGCNTCTCNNGQVGCTEIACPPKTCTYNGQTYKEGESFPATDGCNTCTCSKGQVGCTKIACPPQTCTYNGQTYKEGDSFPATDGCNKCSCKSGQVVCTQMACPPQTCTYNGQTYKDGDSFPATDGCNKCTCSNGQVNCTKIACPPGACQSNKDCQATEYCELKEGSCGGSGTCKTTPTACTRIYLPVCGCDNKTYSNDCTAYASRVSIKSQGACSTTTTCSYNGQTYQDGDTFAATDGCNTCKCSSGQVICTQNTCTAPCTYNGQTYKHGDSFPATDGCNTCTCNNGQVGCTKIACPPKTCTYNGQTYKDGEKFVATDGCNTCNCQAGIVGCTRIGCTVTCKTDSDCKTGEFCRRVPEFCTTTVGNCRAKSTTCTQQIDYVCGCDNKTYSNECMAYAAGVSIAYAGQCKCSGCSTNKDCSSTEYCALSAGQCSGCGTCTTKPQACTQIYKPVCGCDNKTYGNSCSAAGQGVNVLATGACP